MSSPGFIDHIGIGVPDLPAAKRYYDELMPILGLRAWFATTEAGEFNYGPAGARGSQVFFYQALEPAPYSRHGTGLQHLSFAVSSRAQVREAHDWAVAHNAEVVHEPREFPSTASTTPRTSLIPTASCSRSSATAPARRDSRRTGSRRCDGIPALEPAGRPLRRGSSAGRQAAGQAGRWPSVTAIPAGRNASQTLPNVPAEVLPSTVLTLGSSGGEAWFSSATRSCPDARGIASRQSASTGEVSWLPP
jgi:catechol 2,3-dioxygenase-like lactoylglutathione lyase family enzyme